VECRPLKKSAEIASVACLVDAVLIVVEANETTRSQLERLARTIHMAGGHVLGYILNKRTYPVPSSVYQFFERAGLI
jgi:Mrp family chromosome partitioning ATPase